MATKTSPHQKRMARVRKALAARGNLRPRLSVFRSSKNIYAQIIDDAKGVTRRFGLEPREGLQGRQEDRRRQGSGRSDRQADCRARHLKAGVKDVVFDRGGYLYHGRVKALADAAREGGLNF